MKRRDNEEVNGYRNYNTWTVALWLDNERSSFEHWRLQARHWLTHARRLPQVTNGCWTIAEAARIQLADELEQSVLDNQPLVKASLYADLLRWAIAEVDWQQIAANWLDEIRDDIASCEKGEMP